MRCVDSFKSTDEKPASLKEGLTMPNDRLNKKLGGRLISHSVNFQI